MKDSNNLLRRIGLGLLALGAASSALAFAFVVSERTGLPVKWPAGTIRLRIMLGATPVLSDGTNYNSSVVAATTTWNNVIGITKFQTEIVAAGSPVDNNDLNDLGFAASYNGKSFGTETLAVTTGYSTGNTRNEADVYFNSAYTWDSYRGALRSSPELQRVAIHELGHVLGLDHPDEKGQSVNAIMNSRVSNLDTLASDDMEGASQLYGNLSIPPLDRFADAFRFNSAPFNASGLTGLATKEAGEPSHAGNAGGSSVWYRWTAPANATVNLDTKGSYFDTTLAVYTGTSVSGLTAVASDDDIEDGVIQASQLSFQARKDVTYSIAIDGFDGDSGGYKLTGTTDAPVATAPSITAQPVSVSVASGGSASFSVTATGTDPLAYQWLFNTNPIAGATSATLSLSSVSSAQAGTYTVTVTNAVGSTTSTGATLTVTAPPPPAPTPTPPPSGGGGGGGGGGAPSLWFCAALAALGLGRLRRGNLRPEA